MYSKSKLRHIGIQFFAEGGEGGEGGEPAGGSGSGGNDGGGSEPAGDAVGKTFTQEEVNRMLAAEKRQGKHSVLKALGLDPNDKEAEKKAKEILDQHKTQKQLDEEALNREKEARTAAEGKATAAERKYLTLISGCKKEFIEEVSALASAKVTDEVTYEDALKAVKEKCPGFFEDENDGDDGTGSGQGHKRQTQKKKPGSLGASLAQSAVSSLPKTNPYFSN